MVSTGHSSFGAWCAGTSGAGLSWPVNHSNAAVRSLRRHPRDVARSRVFAARTTRRVSGASSTHLRPILKKGTLP